MRYKAVCCDIQRGLDRNWRSALQKSLYSNLERGNSVQLGILILCKCRKTRFPRCLIRAKNKASVFALAWQVLMKWIALSVISSNALAVDLIPGQ